MGGLETSGGAGVVSTGTSKRDFTGTLEPSQSTVVVDRHGLGLQEVIPL